MVGLRQTKDPHTPLISQDLIISESGLYANDLALNWLTNKNINLCIDDYEAYAYAEWIDSADYLIGERIAYQGTVYLALVNNTNVAPDTDAAQWQVLFEVPSLSTWLSEMKMAVIKDLVNSTLEKNQAYHNSQVLSPDSLGSSFEGNVRTEVASLENNFYGYALRPCKRNDAQLQIRRVGLQVETAQTLTFYVFHYSRREAIKTYTIEILPEEVGKFVWKTLADEEGKPCVLDYFQSQTNAGGDFTIGVFRGEITGDIQSFVLNEYSETYNPKRNHFKGLFDLDFIEVPERFLNGNQLFDVSQIVYYREKTLFNLDVIAYSDQTYQIIASARLWSRALQLGIAVKLLSEMFQSLQLNRISSEAQKEIGFLLHGNKAMEISGLKHRYFNACKELVKQYESASANGFEDRVSIRYDFS